MRRRVLTLLALLALAACLQAGPAAAAEAGAMLALADKPVRIIRGVQVLQGVSGTALDKDDIVETGAGGAQVELGPDSIVALGPQTRVYLLALGQDGKSPASVALLHGWLKVRCVNGRTAQLATAALRIDVAQGAVVVYSEDGRDELFADAGAQQATRLDDKSKPEAPLKVPAENYAFALAGKPLTLQPRPARAFLAAMPPWFRDRLGPGPALGRAAMQPAAGEREVDFADIEPWLNSKLAVRKAFVARFRPRLKDPVFRKALDQALGQGSEWQAVLRPAAARPRPAPNPQ